jgi:hypothetical protein
MRARGGGWGGQVGADGLTSLVNKWAYRRKKKGARQPRPVSNIGEPGLRAGVL